MKVVSIFLLCILFVNIVFMGKNISYAGGVSAPINKYKPKTDIIINSDYTKKYYYCSYRKSDPFESYNRALFDFDIGVVNYVLSPSYSFYDYVTPNILQQGVHNFFSNLYKPYSAVNFLLQGQFILAAKNIFSFAVNSSLGLFGLIDFTSISEQEKTTSLNKTFDTWHIDTGPYLVLPFTGEGTVRSDVALIISLFIDPLSAFSTGGLSAAILNIVSSSKETIQSVNLYSEDSLDFYSFAKNAYYMQNCVEEKPTFLLDY